MLFLAHFSGWSYSELMNEMPAADLHRFFREAHKLYTEMNTPAET